MKFKHFLLLLFLVISFTSCVERIERVVTQDTISPEFTIERNDLTNKISAIIPAEKINITTSKTKKTGESEYNTFHVEVVSPENFPSNGFSFSDLSNEITRVVQDNISNIEDFQKMEIEVRNTVEENDTKHTRTYKKEIDL